jgi:hypothetical protein
MAYKSYDAYLSVKPSTNKEYYRQSLQQLVDRDFENAPNFETIQKYNRTYSRFEDIDVRLVQAYEVDNDDRKSSDDLVTIQFQDLDQEDIYMGDLYEFGGYRWITIETKTIATLAKTCLVKRCNSEFKFTTATPLSDNVITIDAFAEMKINKVTAENYKIIPHATMTAIVPYNSDTQNFRYDAKKGTRFLLGDPQAAWQIVNIDSVRDVKRDTDGNLKDAMLTLYLEQVQIHPKDDTVNGVAWQMWF